jgi:uncharacterized protein (DUF305 family)
MSQTRRQHLTACRVLEPWKLVPGGFMTLKQFLCTAFMAAAACTTDQGGAPLAGSGDGPDEVLQTLDQRDSRQGQCRGRYYWTCKDARTPHSPRSDVELIDTLVPHHQAAIEMAELELAQGADAEVRSMAEMMKSAQAAEIEVLLRIREELTGCTTVAPFPAPHTRADIEKMSTLAGRELDVFFLESMIPHHAGAIEFTHSAMPRLQHPELQELAHDVIDQQAMEVGEMHGKKKELAP